MNVARRRRWIIGANSLLILFYVYGFYSEITFRSPLEKYMGRVPMPQVLTQILQEKKWSLTAANLLILGLGAEFRKKKVAAFVNTAAYLLILAIFICDCASLAGHPEHLLPYVLAGAIPSALMPALVLALYRREIINVGKAH